MSRQRIEDAVRESVESYFEDLGRAKPHEVYDMMLPAFEKPLLTVVMQRADGNQSRAAQWLGLNRNTLRKKLTQHGLL
jgi:Fis family transcriptional regulator, factor for inversion stimulation protein